MRAGPGRGLTGIFPDLCFQSRSSAACLTRRPCLVCHYSSRSISLSGLPGRPQAESLTGRWAGPGALWGGYGYVLPALLVCTFRNSGEGSFSPSLSSGWVNTAHVAKFSKYFQIPRDPVPALDNGTLGHADAPERTPGGKVVIKEGCDEIPILILQRKKGSQKHTG